MRRRLPQTRSSQTTKLTIGNHEAYITVGFYGDGRPGELFVKIAKEGSTLSGLVDGLAVTASMLLQNGVKWETIRDKWMHTKFEPSDHQYSSLLEGIAMTVDASILSHGDHVLSAYVAASFPRRAEAKAMCDWLANSLGIASTARWVTHEHTTYGEEPKFAVMDLEDVAFADYLIVITGDSQTRGGRHSELGIAIALGKRILLYGPREQVFHHHPLVETYETLAALQEALTPDKERYVGLQIAAAEDRADDSGGLRNGVTDVGIKEKN